MILRRREVKSKILPYIESATEAGCACLITMVQGNLLTSGIAHWIIATQTGLITGAIAGTTIVTAKLRKQWLISLMLGVISAVVDFNVHRETFGTMAVVEAAITGVGAALLSYLASLPFRLRKRAMP